MRTEHTTSEVTEQEGLTDAQFFYGEIMKLQKKCYALEQDNMCLKDKCMELSSKNQKLRTEKAKYEHIIYWLKSLNKLDARNTKAKIIKTINLYVKAADICHQVYDNGTYFTDCLAIAGKERYNDSINS